MGERRVVMVCSGDGHSLLLTACGRVFTWGFGFRGQLGLSSQFPRPVPTLVETLEDVSAVGVGYNHSLAVRGAAKEVFVWGAGSYGALGLGDASRDCLVPTLVPELRDIAAVDGGYQSSFALGIDGSLVSWGYNGEGQLGHGDRVHRLLPTVVETLGPEAGRRVVDVAAGFYHCLALTTEGSIYSWGNGGHGKLGDGDGTDHDVHVPTRIVDALEGVHKAVRVAAGDYHSMAVTDTGQLLTWGNGGYGRLGHGADDESDKSVPTVVEGVSNVVGVGSGTLASLVSTEGGAVAAWGRGR
jgi:alpha-tubulin suppressor-like RCC1 family protein